MPGKSAKKTAKTKGKKAAKRAVVERATVLSSEVVYQGPLFRVHHDTVLEPAAARTSAK